MEKIPEYLGKTERSIETTYRWKVKMRAFWHFFPRYTWLVRFTFSFISVVFQEFFRLTSVNMNLPFCIFAKKQQQQQKKESLTQSKK